MIKKLTETTPLERSILLLKLYGYKLDLSDEILKTIFWISPSMYQTHSKLSDLKLEIKRSLKKLMANGLLIKKNKNWELGLEHNHWEYLEAFRALDKKLLKECQRVIINRHGQYFGKNNFHRRFTDCFFNVMRASFVLGQNHSFTSRLEYTDKVLNDKRKEEWMEELLKAYKLYFLDNKKQPDKAQRELKELIINNIILQALGLLKRLPDWFLEEMANPKLLTEPKNEITFGNRGLFLLLTGQWKLLEHLIKDLQSPNAIYLKGILNIFRGHYEKGIKSIYKANEVLRNKNNYNQWRAHYTIGILPIFWFLALHKETNPQKSLTKEYIQGINHYSEYSSKMSPLADKHLEVLYHLANKSLKDAIKTTKETQANTTVDLFINTLFHHHLKIEINDNRITALKEHYKKTVENGFTWLQFELAHLLSLIEGGELDKESYKKENQALADQLNAVSLTSLYTPKELWVDTLSNLKSFFSPKRKKTGAVQSNHKLAAYVFFKSSLQKVELKIKKRRKNGGWTRGKKINNSFYPSDELGLSKKETKIISIYLDYINYGYWEDPDPLEFEQNIIQELIGFEELYDLQDTDTKLILKSDSPKMFMQENKDQINISFNYFPSSHENYYEVFKTGFNEYTYVEFSDEQLDMLSHFSLSNMSFPASVSEQVLAFIDKFEDIIPLETLLLRELEELPRHPGDPTPHLHLSRITNQYQLDWYVKPDPDSTLLFHPSEGRRMYKTLNDKGEIVLLERDKKKEEQLYKESIRSLELSEDYQRSKHQWLLDNDEHCLEVLLRIQSLKNEQQIIVEWPKGKPLTLAQTLDTSNLKFQISKGKNYWFDVDATVETDSALAISFKELLALTEDGSKKFIRLTDQQFVGITNDLRRQLQTARALLQKDKKDQYKMHAVSASAMEEIFESAGTVTMDDYWREAKEKFEKARNIRPQVPKSFKAELRPYQKKGYKWMMQLAEWGVGGCLADDMGLGKTIQALAVMCARKNKGPALVVAPSSVTHNWLRETEKFAPKLHPEIFGPGDRKEMLEGLKKGSLLICSYGLMQSEIELLEKVEFQMVLLDEAQAIKNFATKRYKAAVRLNGEFKMATTGTPVENHLGELWSLFNFLNPGMLGSTAHFRDKFAKAINSGEEHTLNQLKNLVQPFILRRHKSKVLKDLPPKTEINYSVDLSKEEKALYDGMRQLSLEKIQRTMENQKKGQSHITVLAELTKLRRACCHPSLANSKLKMKGSKLESVKELVSDLLENEHKVLIFSQFVDFLKIVRKWMDDSNISYQYLDGSTSNKKREKAVQAFQNGDGDAFLISLKAGGVGLNLTEADYVLILDPWWNPAVESQAADRAHRMGQKKPVTVYRFVTENTIEEKIIELHKTKQELAESLLQGTDKASKITTNDLLELLQSSDTP